MPRGEGFNDPRLQALLRAALDPRLSAADKAVHAAIVLHMRAQLSAHPGLLTIARVAQVSDRSVPRSLLVLVAAGHLAKGRAAGHRANVYTLPNTDTPVSDTAVSVSTVTDKLPGPSVTQPSAEEELLEARKEKAKAPRHSQPLVTFARWQASLTDEEDTRASRTLDDYARSIELPSEMLDLFVEWAHGNFRSSGKKYRDWPAALLNYLRNAWHPLFGRNADGTFYLKTAGLQLQQEIQSRQRKEAA